MARDDSKSKERAHRLATFGESSEAKQQSEASSSSGDAWAAREAAAQEKAQLEAAMTASAITAAPAATTMSAATYTAPPTGAANGPTTMLARRRMTPNAMAQSMGTANPILASDGPAVTPILASDGPTVARPTAAATIVGNSHGTGVGAGGGAGASAGSSGDGGGAGGGAEAPPLSPRPVVSLQLPDGTKRRAAPERRQWADEGKSDGDARTQDL